VCGRRMGKGWPVHRTKRRIRRNGEAKRDIDNPSVLSQVAYGRRRAASNN
jgi:hypothetical protein